MRELFSMIDSHDDVKKQIVRNSSRAIIIKDDKIAMVYSKLYNYYKLPGGGIEKNETMVEALVREVAEEAGLVVKESSIKEFGVVHRKHLSTSILDTMFIQDNFYFLCEVEDGVIKQNLDEYENKEGFTLVYVKPSVAIETNRLLEHGPKSKSMLEREARVLELLVNEGYFKK